MIITIYGRKDCHFCILAKKLIKNLKNKYNLQYQYIDINKKNISLKELSKKIEKKITTIPQIIIDEKYIGGYEDFYNYCKINKLI